jgi:MFS family permease
MTALLAACVGLLVAIVVDVLAGRAGLSRIAAYGISLLAGAVVALALAPAWPLTVLALYAPWWFVFLNFTQGLESSLRIRLLREVQAEGGQIERAALLDRYNDASLLRLRLQRLLDGGAVLRHDGRLVVASAGLRAIARFFRLLKRLLLGRDSEFAR